MNKKNIIIFIALVAVAIFSRAIPHTPNFTAVGAVALVAGYYLPRKASLLLPVTAMLLSDIFIGFYDLKIMAIVYASFAMMSFSGILSRKNLLWLFSGPISFFVVTNGAVWLFSSHYAHTLSGLIQCYTLAIPFFRNSLLGDLMYGSVLFSAMAFIPYVSKMLYKVRTLKPSASPANVQ